MNIVFDFGGLLFRWQQHEFMARLLPAHAPDAPSAHALVVSFFQGFGRAWGEFDRGASVPPPMQAYLREAQSWGIERETA